MAGFDFYERRGNLKADNLFFGGASVTDGTITPTVVTNAFNVTGLTINNMRMEGGIIKGFIYRPNSGTPLIKKDGFRNMGSLDYAIIDNRGFFDMFDTDGFEFFQTNIDYIWMPYFRNSLGRQAFQNTKWIKRAFVPNVLNLGRRTFVAGLVGTAGDLCRIYAPSATNCQNDSFFGTTGGATRYQNVVLYLDENRWNASSTFRTRITDTFLDGGGNLVLITDYTKPSIPSNVTVTNVTATTFDITFNPSTFTNGFGWYEIFCETDDNPVSWYFHHQEILTATATITGLVSGKTYRVKVRAADEYMNLSPFTNSQSITML